MNTLKEVLYGFWYHDFGVLFDSNLTWTIYLILFIIVFLENGLLPVAFLPGDSLLVLIGILISKGMLNFYLTLIILTIAASLGSWVSYIQGKWLENNQVIKSWLIHLPTNYYQRACQMFYRHGLSALIIGRFIAFVRTLLPIIAGLSGLGNLRFHFFNWISAFLWVYILTLTGFFIGKVLILHRHEGKLIFYLILIPLVILTIGLAVSLIIIWRRKRFAKFK